MSSAKFKVQIQRLFYRVLTRKQIELDMGEKTLLIVCFCCCRIPHPVVRLVPTLLPVYATICLLRSHLVLCLMTQSMHRSTLYSCWDPVPSFLRPGLTFLDRLPKMCVTSSCSFINVEVKLNSMKLNWLFVCF